MMPETDILQFCPPDENPHDRLVIAVAGALAVEAYRRDIDVRTFRLLYPDRTLVSWHMASLPGVVWVADFFCHIPADQFVGVYREVLAQGRIAEIACDAELWVTPTLPASATPSAVRNCRKQLRQSIHDVEAFKKNLEDHLERFPENPN